MDDLGQGQKGQPGLADISGAKAEEGGRRASQEEWRCGKSTAGIRKRLASALRCVFFAGAKTSRTVANFAGAALQRSVTNLGLIDKDRFEASWCRFSMYGQASEEEDAILSQSMLDCRRIWSGELLALDPRRPRENPGLRLPITTRANGPRRAVLGRDTGNLVRRDEEGVCDRGGYDTKESCGNRSSRA